MEYQIAFVGNPNVGKSAWINALSDADFKVGNWPGVTIEKKEATVIWDEQRYHLIDLPGTYSLDDITNEENITATYLKNQPVDLIVNVVDATNLSRNLYLTLLLRELQIPMILILNFMDEVEKFGIQIEIQKLSRRLQMPVLPYSALDKEHYDDVKEMIKKMHGNTTCYFPFIEGEDAKAYISICTKLEERVPIEQVSEAFLHRCAIKIIKRDTMMMKQLQVWHIDYDIFYDDVARFDNNNWEQLHYRGVQSLMKYVKEDQKERFKLTRKIDRYLLHKYVSYPILIFIFTLLLLVVFNGSAPFNDYVDFLVNDVIAKYIGALLSGLPEIVQQFILKGVLAGAGGVLTFVPLMTFLYFGLSLLEESGYMSRIAFLLDKAMRKFNLSGKSFVALLLGFGCNVPAIYATRTLDHEKQKRLTALLVPFMSCSARLPVYVIFAAAFFKGKAALMILTIYGIGILLALLFALIFSKSANFKSDELFVLELPPYRMPSMNVVWQKVKQEVTGYIKKATGIVLFAMVILWGLSYLPNGNIQDSYITNFGKSASVLYEPLGFGTRWESVSALPGSIIAKETVVGYFNQVLIHENTASYDDIDIKEDIKEVAYRFGDAIKRSLFFFIPEQTQSSDDTLINAISSLWTDELASLRAFSYMVYLLLSIPCIMTLQAIYREYGKKLLGLSILTMLIVPYVTSLCIFQFFSFIMKL